MYRAKYLYLGKCDIQIICHDFGMSDDHIGGDNVISIVDATLKAIAQGYTICTWYGPETEVLIVGFRETELTIINSKLHHIPA